MDPILVGHELPAYRAVQKAIVTDNGIKFTVKSPMGQIITEEMEVSPDDYLCWAIGGVLIQEAMPNLTPDQRELLMTGLIFN